MPIARRLLRWPIALSPLAALLATCSGRAVHAFDKRTCAAAYESAQLYRHQQKLRKAREQLVVCAHNSCPAVVTSDCTSWLKEVDAAIPTLLFRVRDERGRAVSEFRVLVDGELISRDGEAPFPFDPGPHLVRIEAEALAPLEQNIVIKAGERGRLVESTLLMTRRDGLDLEPAVERRREAPRVDPRVMEKANADRASVDKMGFEKTALDRSSIDKVGTEKPSDVKPSSDPPPAEPSSARETAMYISGGVGLFALASGVYLGLAGQSEVNDMRSTCAPDCAKSDVDAARTKLVGANVAFGVGIGALTIAGLLWLSGPSEPPKPSTGRTRFIGLDVRPSPFGGGGEVVTTFSAP